MVDLNRDIEIEKERSRAIKEELESTRINVQKFSNDAENKLQVIIYICIVIHKINIIIYVNIINKC